MKSTFLILSLLLASQTLLGQFQICNSPTNKDLHDVWFIDQNIGIAVGDSGTIVRSVDGGVSWDLAMSIDTISFKKVKFFDELNGIAIGSDIYITTNAGLNWSQIPHSNSSFYDVEILSQTTCIISGYPIALVKSIDAGASFFDMVSHQDSHIGLLSFVDENIGFSCNNGAGGPSPTLKTINGGISWDTIPSGPDVNTVMEAMCFISETIGFKGGWYNPHLQKTIDSANEWNDVAYNDSLISSQLYDFHIEQNQPDAYYACGWYGQVLKSTDGGNNWFVLASGLSNTTSLNGIFFVNDSIGWAVGNHGTIIRTTNGGTAVGLLDTEKELELSLFPNPTRGLLYVNNPKRFKILQYEIYSMSGKKLMSEDYYDVINLSQLSVGMYIVEIETNEGDFSIKIIKE